MAVFRDSVVLVANATNPNVLNGSQIEINGTGRAQRVVISASSSVATTGLGVQFGSRSIAQSANTLAPLETAAGLGPVVPDDVLVDDIVLPNERILISLVDGGAGSTTRVLVVTG